MRLWHEGVGRSGGNLCSSKLFLHRVEQEYTLDEMLHRDEPCDEPPIES